MYFIGASVITRGSHFFNSIDSIFLKLEEIPYIFFLLASWQKGERKYSEIRISKSHSSKSHSGYFLNEPVCRAVVGRLAASTLTHVAHHICSYPSHPPPPPRLIMCPQGGALLASELSAFMLTLVDFSSIASDDVFVREAIC